MSCTTRTTTTSPSELLSPELLPALTVDAYSAAAAADRRGLSNELVRLHEEIAQSKSYACELEQRLTEMVSYSLILCEMFSILKRKSFVVA